MSLDPHEEPAAIQTHIGAIFISLELSRSKWLITSLIPGGGQKMSKHSVEAGDMAGLLARFWAIRDKVLARTGKSYPIVVIQEAGLDGFWIHRSLVKEGIESHVVDAASIAVSRRRRRAKTDKIDGEGLLRALLAFKRGEPRVCSMVRVPHASGRGSPPDLSRAQDADRRADTACQSDQRPAVFSGDRKNGLSSTAPFRPSKPRPATSKSTQHEKLKSTIDTHPGAAPARLPIAPRLAR